MSNIEVQKEVPLKSDVVQTPPKTDRSSLVELKNGRIVFRQKPLSCEKMSETMQEIVKFRDFLENRMKEEKSPLQRIPDQHVPLIAKLVHESDKTISFLSKYLQEALQPEEVDSEDANSCGAIVAGIAIENAILRLCDRVNYGIDWAEKVSAATSVWRWEVKEQFYDMLPKASREKFESRLAERRQAKQELKALFDALPQTERDLFTKSGKKTKSDASHATPMNDENTPNGTPVADLQHDQKPSVAVDDSPEAKKLVGRPKKDKPIDPERLAKEKERAEKKAAREEKERKQQEAASKSRSIMSSFFSRPKATTSRPSAPASTKSPLKSESSSSRSEFGNSFKPFILKKNATLAPINHFREGGKAKEVILIDQDHSDDIQSTISGSSITEQQGMNSQEPFSEYIKRVTSKRRYPREGYNANDSNYKSTPKYCVRDIFAQLSEAEILGDDAAVRSLQSLLQSRENIPAKVLIFHEDYRPGYFGTFTKSSAVVGPRTPFAKDPISFDYGYDSGEDWEEEEEGADDLVSVDGSEAEKSSDVGSDEFDDWLVDDDGPVELGTPLDEREGSPGFPLPQDLLPKRKAPTAEEKPKEPKKRKVMPLVPFTKGPCLEVNIGECNYEPFNQYRIQLFNDTPFPLNPFTFVSTPLVVEKVNLSKQGFAVPTLPAQVQALSLTANSMVPSSITPSNLDAGTSSSTATAPTTTKRAPLQPKAPLPQALLPYFADKVASLSSGNLTWLVESLYQDLRPHRITKIAIEAKVREDCEKCPIRKVWVVKDDVLRMLGRIPPPPLPTA